MRTMIVLLGVFTIVGQLPPTQAGAAPGPGRSSEITASQTCAGQSEGAGCWLEVANQPECYVWNDYLATEETVTWTGECSGGLAQGTGTLYSICDCGKEEATETGYLQDGKQHGHWVTRDADGNVAEGPFVEGKMHGQWVFRWSDGTVWQEGFYVDGKQHGRWVIYDADGSLSEGSYMEGKMHGDWVWNSATGSVRKWTYMNGEIVH